MYQISGESDAGDDAIGVSKKTSLVGGAKIFNFNNDNKLPIYIAAGILALYFIIKR